MKGTSARTVNILNKLDDIKEREIKTIMWTPVQPKAREWVNSAPLIGQFVLEFV